MIRTARLLMGIAAMIWIVGLVLLVFGHDEDDDRRAGRPAVPVPPPEGEPFDIEEGPRHEPEVTASMRVGASAWREDAPA